MGSWFPSQGLNLCSPALEVQSWLLDHQGSPCSVFLHRDRLYDVFLISCRSVPQPHVVCGQEPGFLIHPVTPLLRVVPGGLELDTHLYVHQPANWHRGASTDALTRSSGLVAQVMLRPEPWPGLPTTPSKLRSHHLIPQRNNVGITK